MDNIRNQMSILEKSVSLHVQVHTASIVNGNATIDLGRALTFKKRTWKSSFGGRQLQPTSRSVGCGASCVDIYFR